MPRRSFTAEQIDAAVAVIAADPGRFSHAQAIVTHAAPGLQHVLGQAIAAGDWFGAAHEQHVQQVSMTDDQHQREAAIKQLIAEETRLSMLVGVAVGLELARELYEPDDRQEGSQRS